MLNVWLADRAVHDYFSNAVHRDLVKTAILSLAASPKWHGPMITVLPDGRTRILTIPIRDNPIRIFYDIGPQDLHILAVRYEGPPDAEPEWYEAIEQLCLISRGQIKDGHLRGIGSILV